MCSWVEYFEALGGSDAPAPAGPLETFHDTDYDVSADLFKVAELDRQRWPELDRSRYVVLLHDAGGNAYGDMFLDRPVLEAHVQACVDQWYGPVPPGAARSSRLIDAIRRACVHIQPRGGAGVTQPVRVDTAWQILQDALHREGIE